jgi:hypothetical protein
VTSIPGDANAYRIRARQTQPLHLPRNETTKATARGTANRSIWNTFAAGIHSGAAGKAIQAVKITKLICIRRNRLLV